jgi:hypothetical protein
MESNLENVAPADSIGPREDDHSRWLMYAKEANKICDKGLRVKVVPSKALVLGDLMWPQPGTPQHDGMLA